MNNEKENNETEIKCRTENCINCFNVYRCTKKEMSTDAKLWNLARLGRKVE